MGLRIGTNSTSMMVQKNLQQNGVEQQKSYNRLSSGSRISSAGDDPAGSAISQNFNAEVRSLKQAERNANDGISFVQVAEGGLSEIGNLLVRLRELSVQSASDTISDKEREYVDKEYQGLKQEVDRIANTSEFNGTKLLNGKSSKSVLDFQVGSKGTSNDKIQLSLKDYNVSTSSLGIDGIDSKSLKSSRSALDSIDQAINHVSDARAGLGGLQARLQSATQTLSVTRNNVAEAYSRVADTDVAEETTKLTQKQILSQAGVAMLAQANSSPQLALKLL